MMGRELARVVNTASGSGSALEVLLVFSKLGISSFGGPIAHLGYFHDEFVTRRRWLDAQAYADLVALCQFLPGPASSQVGFSIGLMRAGYAGAIAAWTGFTLPSAIILLLEDRLSVQGFDLFAAFYRSGALVFGGGHVVLPLLQAQLVAPGWVSSADFLAGYGAAQAVPGPMFAIGAYLGAVAAPAHQALLGALLGLFGIFLPGMLILVAALPFWDHLRRWPAAQAMMAGVNAAVVGLLGAALYGLVWVSAVRGPHDFLLAAGCFLLLVVWRLPAWFVVVIGAAGGLLLGLV